VNTLDIVLLAIAAVLVLAVVAGARKARRRQQAGEERLRARLAAANDALAAAHAGDKGWDRDLLEAAARTAHGGAIDELRLVHVVDNPGTEADEAVFEAVTGGDTREVRLGRVGDEWVAR
jgi:hypothetical protein